MQNKNNSRKDFFPFIDHWRWWFYRFAKPLRIRKWFLRKSGNESAAFVFSRDLSHAKSKFFILPYSLASLAGFLPLLRNLTATATDPNELLFLVPKNFLPLLKRLDLHSFCLAYNPEQFRYGSQTFAVIERRLAERTWDLAVCLDLEPNILQLYLMRKTSSPYRVGFHCEPNYPFLNISLSGLGQRSIYEYRQQLAQQLQIDTTTMEPFLPQDAISQISHNVILLNLETSYAGQTWTSDEIIKLREAIGGSYRFLAINPNPEDNDLGPTLDKLGIRTAPGGASYQFFLEQLRQYPALISLDSPHSYLAVYLSRSPTLIFSDTPLNFANSQVTVIERNQIGKASLNLPHWLNTLPKKGA